jgi:hypothetical protein
MNGGMYFRRRLLAAALLVALPISALVASSAPAAADELDVGNDITYRVLPEEHVVQVEQVVTIQNNKQSTRNGNIITNYFYTSVFVLVPTNAVDFRATVSGRPVDFRYEEANDGYQSAIVSTGSNVYAGERRTIDVVYRVPDAGPRNKGAARVNEAYVTFPIIAAGDLTRTTLRVVLPERFDDVSAVLSKATFGTKEGERILELKDFPKERTFFDIVNARDDDALQKRDVTVAGHVLSVQYWPGDDAWADFQAKEVARAIPVLEKITGEPWPEADGFKLIEAYTPYLLGYAGWYLPVDGKIEVGDELDPVVLYHELAHAWFNRENFRERWINEGFAEELAARASKELGGPSHDPKPVIASDPGAARLSDWQNFLQADSETVRQKEEYGYNTSFAVIRHIADDVGAEKLPVLLKAAIDRDIAYRGDVPAEKVNGNSNWRRVLDLAENIGGSTKAVEELRTYVLNDTESALLSTRTETRAAYTALRSASVDWAPTVYLRRQMDNWDFDLATVSIAEASTAIGVRDALRTRAGALALTMPVSYEAIYEAEAVDLSGTKGKADEIDKALASVALATESVNAKRSLFTKVGLWGRKPTVQLDATRQAFNDDKLADVDGLSRATIATIDAAPAIGKKRVGGAVGGLVFLVGAPTLAFAMRRRRRRRKGLESAVPDPDAELLLANPSDEPSAAPDLIESAELPPVEPVAVEPAPAVMAVAPEAERIGPVVVEPVPVAIAVEPEPVAVVVSEPAVVSELAVVPDPIASSTVETEPSPTAEPTIVAIATIATTVVPAPYEFGKPVELRVHVTDEPELT